MVVFSSLVQKNRSLPDMPLRRTINSIPDTLWIASLYYSDWNHTIHGYEILLESSESALQNNKKISWKLPIWLKLTNVSGLTATWIHDVSCPKPHTPNMLQCWTHGQRSSMHLTWAWIWGPEEPFLSLTNHFVWLISSFSLPNIFIKTTGRVMCITIMHGSFSTEGYGVIPENCYILTTRDTTAHTNFCCYLLLQSSQTGK